MLSTQYRSSAAQKPDLPTLIRETGRAVNPTAGANSTNRIAGDHVSRPDVDSNAPVGATGIPAGAAGTCQRSGSETDTENGEHAYEEHDRST